MATASPETSDPLAVSGWRTEDAESKSERYVGRRLAEAGAEVKGVALTTFLLGSAVAGGLWLVAGVLAEHWIVPGGLPRGVRWGWLAVALAALLAAAIRWLLPLIRYRVNLVYAARAIEREHPELHNDVVNAVLAQARPDESTPFMVRSLRRRAARQLSRVHNDGVVDFRPVLWLASALAVLVVAAVIYELVAPKSLLVSTIRLVAPWAGIAAPARTQISTPTLQWRQPGMPVAAGDGQDIRVVNRAATLIRGRQLMVTTAIRHLRRGERPLAIVTPRRDAGAAASWRVPLAATKNGGFEASLPDATRGLDESVDLVIAAGDAQTDPIRVTVVDAPTIMFREATYHYPKYTGQDDRTVEWQGDLSAVEGTDVTIVAETNQPVDQAWVDFGADGKGDIPLKPGQRDLARVRGQFTLRLNADRNGAEHPTYRLMFKPKGAGSGAQRDLIVDQLEHHIDVVPDLAPETSIVFPEQKVVRVRPDTAVTIRVRAVDPDFGLASVIVETRLKDGPERPGRDLLAARGTKDRRTRFEGDEILVPERLGAGAGAVLEYRAVVTDTRPEKPNKTATEWQSLVIDIGAPQQLVPPPLPNEQSGVDDGDGRGGRSEADGGRGGQASRPDAAADQAEQQDGEPGEPGDTGREEPGSLDQPQQQERKGGEQRPSGDSGEQDRQQPKSRQNDPKPAQDEGAPQQGEDQGSADGGKSQDGMKGKTGNQAGQRQQDGSSDGAGGQPEGRGGAGQAGDQAGQGREGTDGAPQRPGAGGQEKKPGGAARGSDAQDADQGGGRDQRGEGRRPGKNGGQAEQREEVASDGTADGDAMERILEHRRKVKPGDGGAQDPQTGSEPGTDAQANDRKPGERSGREGNKPAGAEDPTGPPSDGQARKQQPCNSPDGKPCGKPGCPSCGGGMSGGAAGGSATDGTSGSVADGGQPGSAGTKPSGTESGGGAPASAGGSADGERNRPEVADGGESGKASGSQGKNDGTGGAGGRDPASESTASDLGSGNESDRGSDGSDGGATPSDTAPSGSQAGGGERGEGSAANTTKPGGDEVAGDHGADEQNPGDASGREGGGGAVGGGQRQQANGGSVERQDRPIEWTNQDLSHARNAADLALEHLRRSVDSGDRAVLDELGWTIEQAREFLARWERMREAAGGGDRRARSEFDEAVKSLGLRPAGARRTGDVPSDAKRGQAEGRRSRPPSDYREQFRAFLQGAAVE